MLVHDLITKECIDNGRERFVPVGAPTPMTAQKLIQTKDIRADVDAGQVAVFAVDHQQGVVQRDADEFETEAMNVLYLTADGEYACERWYLGEGPKDFSTVVRACIVDIDEFEPTGEHARRLVPITRRHPEVEN